MSIPKSKNGIGAKAVPWWTADCGRAVREKRKALNRYRKSLSAGDHLLMKQTATASKKQIAAVKRDYLVL